MQFRNKVLAVAASVVCAASLVGCGGGGGDGTGAGGPSESGGQGGGGTPPASAAAIGGRWLTSTSLGDAMEVESFPDGTVWAWYTPRNKSSAEGFIRATTTVAGGSISGSAVLFDFVTGSNDGQGAFSAQVTAGQQISGQMSGARAMTFQGPYDASYEVTPVLATVAGTYIGSIDLANKAARLEIMGSSTTTTVDATGAVSGSILNSCNFTGTITPKTAGNAYDMVITTSGCPTGYESLSGLTLTGIFRYDSSNKMMMSVGSNATNDGAVMLNGVKVN